MVTDDLGAPISGASVTFGYYGHAVTKTNTGGGYGLGFDASPPVTLLIRAWSPGFETNAQVIPWETQSAVINLHLRRTRTITAGEPITVSIESDSSICWDQEDSLFEAAKRCESFVVVTDRPGTLIISADLSEVGGSVPMIAAPDAWYRGQVSGQFTGQGPLSILRVQAGESYRIFAGLPDGTSQRIVLSTSVQP